MRKLIKRLKDHYYEGCYNSDAREQGANILAQMVSIATDSERLKDFIINRIIVFVLTLLLAIPVGLLVTGGMIAIGILNLVNPKLLKKDQ